MQQLLRALAAASALLAASARALPGTAAAGAAAARGGGSSSRKNAWTQRRQVCWLLCVAFKALATTRVSCLMPNPTAATTSLFVCLLPRLLAREPCLLPLTAVVAKHPLCLFGGGVVAFCKSVLISVTGAAAAAAGSNGNDLHRQSSGGLLSTVFHLSNVCLAVAEREALHRTHTHTPSKVVLVFQA